MITGVGIIMVYVSLSATHYWDYANAINCVRTIRSEANADALPGLNNAWCSHLSQMLPGLRVHH